jgi:hypothetical protein
MSPDGTFALIADTANNRIRRLNVTSNEITTVAGSGQPAYSDGVGTSASFFSPSSVAMSPDGTFSLICDRTNHRIRRFVVGTGRVTTVAGRGSASYINGIGTAAGFNLPNLIAISPDAAFALICDNLNYRVRHLNLTTFMVTTLAGSGVQGSVSGVGVRAAFMTMNGISISHDGAFALVSDLKLRRIDLATSNVTNVLSEFSTCVTISHDDKFAVLGNGQILGRFDLTTGNFSIIAGTTAASGSTFSDGIGTQAVFSKIAEISLSPDDTFALVSDIDNVMIRKIYLSRPCSAGYYCPASSPNQIVCPIGSVCPFHSVSPTTCPNGGGQLCHLTGLSAPLPCLSGFACSANSFNMFGALDVQGLFCVLEFFYFNQNCLLIYNYFHSHQYLSVQSPVALELSEMAQAR